MILAAGGVLTCADMTRPQLRGHDGERCLTKHPLRSSDLEFKVTEKQLLLISYLIMAA